MTTTGTTGILPQAPAFNWPDLHQLDPVLVQRWLQHRLERRAIPAERFALDDEGRDAAGLRLLQSAGIGGPQRDGLSSCRQSARYSGAYSRITLTRVANTSSSRPS